MGHRTYQEQGSPIGESAVVAVSYLVLNDTLWQYATDIDRKCNSCILQNMSGFVLQNAAVLLQNMTVSWRYRVQCNYPVRNYMFKVNNRNTRTKCEICSEVTVVFIVNFEHISHLVLVFLLLTLNI